MRIEKFGHACVRIQVGDVAMVIDPGGLTPEDALQGVDHVLITHEHFDHFSEAKIREATASNPRLRIFTQSAVAAHLTGLADRTTVVGDGDRFDIEDVEVTVHGTWHAELHSEIPRMRNVGFLVDGSLFHPGDALTTPGQRVDTLLLPIHGPWSRMADLIDYVRDINPDRVLGVHDAALNEIGLGMTQGLLGTAGPGIGAPYIRIAPGEELALSPISP